MNNERRAKAEQLLAKIDGLFHHAEKSTPNQEVTYLDVVRIADFVRDQFGGGAPPEVSGALEMAVGLCHPKKLEGVNLIMKGIGAIFSATGGFAVLWGVLYIIAYGVVVTSTVGLLWWETTTVSILFGGPVGIGLGVLSLAGGFYLFAQKASPKRRAITALDVMRDAINKWAEG
jgi:hypothetical protein